MKIFPIIPFLHHKEKVKEEQEKLAELDRLGEEGKLVLSTSDLVKKYRQRTVVNHVSINVHQGEIVGLLGPNGAGKTTTFYMTTGLITPNAGSIFLNDYEITKYPVYKRAQHGIGYLAQEASVFRKLTVEDNIRCILEMTNTTPDEQAQKLEDLINEFSLQKVRKNTGDRLSGGERRRTEIARCLAINPRFIMLDEPVSHLDNANNAIVARLIADEAERQGAGVIATSVGNNVMINVDKELKL